MASDDVRITIINATMDLAAVKPILSVSLGEIAERAGVSLADLRARYESRIAILEDFSAYIDEQALTGGAADHGEPARERLLDVMMRRFDALAPYRPGLKGIRKAAMRDPLFAATLNHIAVGSQKWTLAAARLEPTGPFAPVRRLARAEALVLVTASVLPTFLSDHEDGLPKTMAALDAALKRLDRVATVVTRMETMVDRICAKGPRWKRHRPKGHDGDEGPSGGGSGLGPSGGSGLGPSGPGGGPKPAGVYAKGEPMGSAAAGGELDVDALEQSLEATPEARQATTARRKRRTEPNA